MPDHQRDYQEEPDMPLLNVVLKDWVWPADKVPDWSTHQLGKNYAAKLDLDESAPDGYRRLWAPKAKGVSGFVMRGFAAGDAIEVGSTGINEDRTIKRNRLYGVIRQVERDNLLIDLCEDIKAATRLSQDTTANLPSDGGAAKFIQRQIRTIDSQIAGLQEQRLELLVQIGTLVKTGIEATGIEMPETEVKRIVEDSVATLPLHRIMGTSPTTPKTDDDDEDDDDDEVSDAPAQVSTQAPTRAPARVTSPSAADQDDDDDEDELTPAQKASLAKIMK